LMLSEGCPLFGLCLMHCCIAAGHASADCFQSAWLVSVQESLCRKSCASDAIYEWVLVR
jgi:hypothetical protein